MNSKDVKGIMVLGVNDGQSIGPIERAYLDPAGRRVAGFAVKAEGGFLRPELHRLIDAEEVHSLGPDVMTLTDPDTVQGETTSSHFAEFVDLDAVSKLNAVTEDGRNVGHVVSVDFDEASFQITQIHVSPGYFTNGAAIPIDQVITLGSDVVVVTTAVGDASRSEQTTASATSSSDLLTLARRWYEETSSPVAGVPESRSPAPPTIGQGMG